MSISALKSTTAEPEEYFAELDEVIGELSDGDKILVSLRLFQYASVLVPCKYELIYNMEKGKFIEPS